jgi:bisphosphoglycerate-independent phosphoglycerate mutase (AlkP superfamily)
MPKFITGKREPISRPGRLATILLAVFSGRYAVMQRDKKFQRQNR